MFRGFKKTMTLMIHIFVNVMGREARICYKSFSKWSQFNIKYKISEFHFYKISINISNVQYQISKYRKSAKMAISCIQISPYNNDNNN